MKDLIPHGEVTRRIFLIRGFKVMLDSDLAELFGVETKQLNRQVKRNIQRFPSEFMFRLTKQERDELVPIWHQFEKMKYSYVLPNAFTEYGVIMLANVLKSERAIKMSIIIDKAFVKLRELMLAHKEIAFKLKELENKVEEHDVSIRDIFEAIRRLMKAPDESNRKITGFTPKID